LAVLLMVAVLSVAGKAHACKTVQMLALAGVAATSMHASHGAEQRHDEGGGSAHQPTDLLRHAGPCHLLISVALPTGDNRVTVAGLPESWPTAPVPGFSSRNWPPPKHRPRAA
jgi:hypothetical protein